MVRLLMLAVIWSAVPQDPPEPVSQIRVNSTLYGTEADLWVDVGESDPAFRSLREDLAKRIRDLDSESIEVRNKAAGAIRALGLSMFGAIKQEAGKAKSAQVRTELESILKDMAGEVPAALVNVPGTRALDKAAGESLRKLLKEKKARVIQQPFLTLREGHPATIFVGDEIPALPGKKRLRIDPDGRKLRLEETGAARSLKFGFAMEVRPKVTGKDRKSVTLEIAITHSEIRKPIREVDTPFGPVAIPEVIEVGIDLSPDIQSGQSLIAGPFPSPGEKEAPWWLLPSAEVIVLK